LQLFAINYLSDKAFTPSADDVAEDDGMGALHECLRQ
jgi:hypothetical protein